MQRYATVEKKIGETPLMATERQRTRLGLSKKIPLCYAGRLDPMASGKLLVLIGDECKQQAAYHGLDKEYKFSVFFGLRSDTGDVLGVIQHCKERAPTVREIKRTVRDTVGDIKLPYPHFSSKTVEGKPLHTWTLEGRINEIEVPTKQSKIYKLKLNKYSVLSGSALTKNALTDVNSLPTVTEASKALGRDFRRRDVRASWQHFLEQHANDQYTVASFTCIASSGTYMRSLAEHIAGKLGTCGLASGIHRKNIGTYKALTASLGLWTRRY